MGGRGGERLRSGGRTCDTDFSLEKFCVCRSRTYVCNGASRRGRGGGLEREQL